MFIKAVRFLFFLTFILLLSLLAWFSFEYYVPQKTSPEEVIVEIEKGKSVKSIAQSLQDKGLIRRKWVFLLGKRIFFSSQSLKAGEYGIRRPASTRKVLEILSGGRVLLHPVTIPEGLTRLEIASLFESQNLIDSDDFLKASSETSLISRLDKQAADLEGYLFPETYHFPRGTTAREVVTALAAQFKEVFGEDWQERARKIGMRVREVVTLASLIEKETSRPEEKGLISAVFHNRLKKGMKLDCDPTIFYALKNQGTFIDRLRTKDLQLDSPYNTYLYAGLPPGPIANPGRESLRAALFPADEDYLYFASKNDGSHHFSRTYREHRAAVNTYQKGN